MKRRRAMRDTHIGFRLDPELNARWRHFLQTQPPIPKSTYLNQMLEYYLDQAERYGLDPITLRPKSPKK